MRLYSKLIPLLVHVPVKIGCLRNQWHVRVKIASSTERLMNLSLQHSDIPLIYLSSKFITKRLRKSRPDLESKRSTSFNKVRTRGLQLSAHSRGKSVSFDTRPTTSNNSISSSNPGSSCPSPLHLFAPSLLHAQVSSSNFDVVTADLEELAFFFFFVTTWRGYCMSQRKRSALLDLRRLQCCSGSKRMRWKALFFRQIKRARYDLWRRFTTLDLPRIGRKNIALYQSLTSSM